MTGYTIWFTGLSGSGKTTIANWLVRRLRKEGIPVVLFDETPQEYAPAEDSKIPEETPIKE